MIMGQKQQRMMSDVCTVLFWGAIWGIFEATAGYALHLMPWKIGAYIWFPAAYFFMDRVHQATGKRKSILAVALLSAAIKLLNLFSPMRPDYVINPAVSIVLESLAMICVYSLIKDREGRDVPLVVTARVLFANTLWRLMYTFYVGLIVPAWMREVSVIRDAETYLSFICVENLISTVVCAASLGLFSLPKRLVPGIRLMRKHPAVRYVATGILLCCSMLLQFYL